MTNYEIIEGAKKLAGIAEDVEVDTFAGWKAKGYCVNKGEHASFKTKIWKPCKIVEKLTEEEKQKLYMVNAAFFTINQVAKQKSLEDLIDGGYSFKEANKMMKTE